MADVCSVDALGGGAQLAVPTSRRVPRYGFRCHVSEDVGSERDSPASNPRLECPYRNRSAVAAGTPVPKEEDRL